MKTARLQDLAVGAALVGILLSAVHVAFIASREPQRCEMSYMWPEYHLMNAMDASKSRLGARYRLYLYRDQDWDSGRELHGDPIIFVPGNAGSFKQVRSIGSESAAEVANSTRRAENCQALRNLDPEGQWDCSAFSPRRLDFFALDFGEEYAAFRGATLLDQAEYLNDVLKFVRDLYGDSSSSLVRKMTVVSHSFGGIVARLATTLPNYEEGSIGLILTLATPHARAPVVLDRTMDRIHERLNARWIEKEAVKLISIAGGNRDFMFGSELCSTESFLPASSGFTSFATGLSNVWLTTDHLSILWCNQLVRLLARNLVWHGVRTRAGQTDVVDFWERSLNELPNLPVVSSGETDQLTREWESSAEDTILRIGLIGSRVELSAERYVHRARIQAGSFPYLHYNLRILRHKCGGSRPGFQALLFQSVTCSAETKVFRPSSGKAVPISLHCDQQKESGIAVDLKLLLDRSCESSELFVELDFMATIGRIIKARFMNLISFAVGTELYLIVAKGAVDAFFAERTTLRLRTSFVLATSLILGRTLSWAVLPAQTFELLFSWTALWNSTVFRSVLEVIILVPLAVTLEGLAEMVLRALIFLFRLCGLRQKSSASRSSMLLCALLASVPVLIGAPFGVGLVFQVFLLTFSLPGKGGLSISDLAPAIAIVLLAVPNGMRMLAAFRLWRDGTVRASDRQTLVYIATAAFSCLSRDMGAQTASHSWIKWIGMVAGLLAFSVGEQNQYLVTDIAATAFAVFSIKNIIYLKQDETAAANHKE